jgi:integrase
MKALDRGQIEDFRFHDLRHTAASYLVMNGATLHEAGEVLGHKSMETTKRYVTAKQTSPYQVDPIQCTLSIFNTSGDHQWITHRKAH